VRKNQQSNAVVGCASVHSRSAEEKAKKAQTKFFPLYNIVILIVVTCSEQRLQST
jgi:hypothetical protein